VQNKKVERTADYYFLPGRHVLVARRQARQRASHRLLQTAKRRVATLAHVPGVRALYLTGSLAVANASVHDDIDLMVIASPHRLWLTRLLLTLVTTLRGWRRTPGATKVHAKVCLNLYLTEGSYALPPSKRSLYTAYELIQAVPIYDPSNTRAALLAANAWLYDYLPHAPSPKITKFRTLQNTTARNFWSRLLDVAELLAYHLQYAYMRPKMTREYVTKEAAFFHPHDPTPPALQ
jgi:hypothetical protein